MKSKIVGRVGMFALFQWIIIGLAGATITDDINPINHKDACYVAYQAALANAYHNFDVCREYNALERVNGASESVYLPSVPTPRTYTDVITLSPDADLPAQPGKYYAATPGWGWTPPGFITDDPDPIDTNDPNGIQDGPDGFPPTRGDDQHDSVSDSGSGPRTHRTPKIVPHVVHPLVVLDWQNESCDENYTHTLTMDTLPDDGYIDQLFSCDVTRIVATVPADDSVTEVYARLFVLASSLNYTWSACDDAVDCAAFLKKACTDRATFLERNSFDATSGTPCSGYCVNGLSITADCKKFKKTGTVAPRPPCVTCN